MNLPLTEGTIRVIAEAQRISRPLADAETGRLLHTDDAVQSIHLFWSLWRDESRAAEILAACGVSDALLESLIPLVDTLQFAATDFATESVDSEARLNASELPSTNGILGQVLDAAHTHVLGLGRNVEIGTEHLLFALLQVDESLRTILRKAGIEPSMVDHTLEHQASEATAPIEPGFQLSLTHGAASESYDTYRILDASANRAREGLRVVEDFVRFSLNDSHLSAQLKQCRHQLAAIESLIPTEKRLSCRDTRGDVGTSIRTSQELRRIALVDVVQADFKRIQEATRSIEEYGKLVSVELSQQAARLRYSVYTLERAVAKTLGSLNRLTHCELYLIVTDALCQKGSGPVIRAAVRSGVRIVQLREKTKRDRELLETAKRVRDWTAEAGCLFIMNDRPDLAVLSNADGVHIGQEELSVAEARRIVGPERLVGRSTHSIEQAREAVLDGADYLGIGPVFRTTTKTFSEYAGISYVEQVSGEVSLPGFCIGGINESNVERVVQAGGRRIAVSSAICSADDPGGAASRLLEIIHATRASLEHTPPPST